MFRLFIVICVTIVVNEEIKLKHALFKYIN